MSRPENYERQLRWIKRLQIHGIKLGLGNITTLLRRMGDPQNDFRSIHVAGSDGKGSTCAIIASVLRAAGYRVGVYSSPHILKFNERFSVDGEDISDDDFARTAARVRHFADDRAESDIVCTQFEVLTAMAFDYFRTMGVDFAVVEVGMGGRFDATNVIVPEVAVINNISMEHTAFLGDTIEKIAYEKAGIIKHGIPSVTLNPSPAADVIKNVAHELNSKLTVVDPEEIEVIENLPAGPRFRFKGEEYRLSIPGRNGAKNAALALTALSVLPEYRERILPYAKEGLETVRWPCRLEDRGDGILVDVTHTAAGSAALAADVSEIYGKVILVFGILSDKDADRVCANLSAVSSAVIVTAPQCERARPSAETLEIMRKHFPDAEQADTVAGALDRAVRIRKEGEKVLVTGSFYMAEEALQWLNRTSR